MVSAPADDRLEAAAQRPKILTPSFVGRQTEVAALSEALARRPALVLVEGEAGIGKSRLVHEVLTSSEQRSRALVASCPPFREPHTLGPLVDATRQAVGDRVRDLDLSPLAGALRPLFPEWLSQLPPAPEPLGDATAARHRVFRAMADLLDRLRVGTLVVEDMHWADEATLEFLLFLTTYRSVAANLVVTWRPEDVQPESLLLRLSSRPPAGTAYLRLTLGPLDVSETAQLVSSMLEGQHVSNAFAAFVHRRTEGLPLAVEESVRLLGERAQLVRRHGQWRRRALDELTVPPTIRDAVLERAARLDADTQLLLRAAAVIAMPTDSNILRRVSGFPTVRARNAMTKALDSRLLAEDGHGQFAFRHALAGRAVYETIPAPNRQELHRRAGEALEKHTPQPLASLVRHFREARDVDRWCCYAETAADFAASAGDHATAAALLHTLVADATLPAHKVVDLTAKIPAAALDGHAVCGDLIDALRAVLLSGDLDSRLAAHARFEIGRLMRFVGREDEARRELELAIPDLSEDALLMARAASILGWPRGIDERAVVHHRWLEQAERLASNLNPEDRLTIDIDRTTALLMLGDDAGWVSAAQIPTNAPTAQVAHEIARAHLNFADCAILWGRYHDAVHGLAESSDLVDRYDYIGLRQMVSSTKAHLDWLMGMWNGLAERVRAPAEDEELLPIARLEAVLVSGCLHGVNGDRARAEELFKAADRGMKDSGCLDYYYMDPAAALARLYVARGDVDQALHVTDEPISIVAGKDVWIWATSLAPARVEALIAAARIDEAVNLVTAFSRGIRGRDAPAPRASATLCRALLAQASGDHGRGARLFGRAADSWQALPRPYDALLARERQGSCLFVSGEREHGLDVMVEVFNALSRFGATADADRVARSLRDLGVSAQRVWRGGRRGYGNALSPKELEVVRLVAAGGTNRDVARTLCRSVRTVEGQLASAMRKLGASSRAGLAARAVEDGLVNSSPPDGPAADADSHAGLGAANFR